MSSEGTTRYKCFTKHFRPIKSILGNSENTQTKPHSLQTRKWVRTEAPWRQGFPTWRLLPGVRIAAGTAELKPPSLLVPVSQIIKSWLFSLPLICHSCGQWGQERQWDVFKVTQLLDSKQPTMPIWQPPAHTAWLTGAQNTAALSHG